MRDESLSNWPHNHVFDSGNQAAERSTWVVMWMTVVAMCVELAAGWWFNSMALLADGWHMSSHAVAIGLSSMAYTTARRYARDPRFAFGAWKIEILGGFASAMFLLGVAVLMLISSVERMISPQAIHYQEAIVVALLGLAVNTLSALILGKAHHHEASHGHSHGHHAMPGHAHGTHHDLNLKSAYLHVIADAATSVLAIAALCGGWVLGWWWLDPFMGIVGAGLVAVWARGLLVDTAKVLLDREMDHPVVKEICEAVESGPDKGCTRIVDLHVWRVGRQAYACAMAVLTHDRALTPEAVRERLSVHEEIVHSTIEIHYAGSPRASPPDMPG